MWSIGFLAYGSGLLASFTPCVVFIVPMLLYKFSIIDNNMNNNALPFYQEDIDKYHKKKASKFNINDFINLLIFLCGFQCCFFIFSFLMNSLLSSTIQQGIQVSLGSLFINLAGLSIKNKINPLDDVPLLHNTFYFGMMYAIMLSFNPCTIPFIAMLFTLPNYSIIYLILFAQGLITPSLLLIFLNNYIAQYINQTLMEKVKKGSHYILLACGIYMIYKVYILSFIEKCIISISFIAIIELVIIKVKNKKKATKKSPKNRKLMYFR